MTDKKYRLVTRSDFDGLACAVLLNELGMIDEIKFVHPKDMQDGKVEISERDITTNLPYVPGVYLAFDHHVSETFRSPGERPNSIQNEHFLLSNSCLICQRIPAAFTSLPVAAGNRATNRLSGDRNCR